MPFPVVTYEEDLQAILTAYRGLQDGRPTHEGSDTFTQASVLAGLAQDLRSVKHWVFDQIFADTADTAELERHALLKTNISRRPAASASGTVILTGAAGTAFASGLQMVDEQDQLFATTASGVIDPDGQAEVSAEALSAGASTNLQAGGQLTLTSPPTGLAGAAEVETAWSGGADAESDAQLLARHLWLLRHPPAGGNKYDYVSWAMSVAGVYAAYAFPLRRGLGTCDVAIVVDSGDCLPGEALIAAVQAVIDELRPCTAKASGVYAPDPVAVNIAAQISVKDGYNVSEVKTRVEAALAALFEDLAPGESLTKALIETTISLVEGVDDRIVTDPAANVTATVDESTIEMLIAGDFDITELS